MHIKIQNFWLYFGVIFLLVLNLIIGYFLVLAKGAINESEYWLNHSAAVIKTIDELRFTYDSAESAGRPTANGNAIYLFDLRQSTRSKINSLRELVSDNQTQTENVGILEETIKQRFQAQDEMKASAPIIKTEEGEFLKVPITQSQKSGGVMDRISASFHAVRDEESILLIARQRLNNTLRTRLWVCICITLSADTIALIIFGVVAIRSNRVREYVAKEVKEEEKNGGASVEKLKELRELIEGKK